MEEVKGVRCGLKLLARVYFPWLLWVSKWNIQAPFLDWAYNSSVDDDEHKNKFWLKSTRYRLRRQLPGDVHTHTHSHTHTHYTHKRVSVFEAMWSVRIEWLKMIWKERASEREGEGTNRNWAAKILSWKCSLEQKIYMHAFSCTKLHWKILILHFSITCGDLGLGFTNIAWHHTNYDNLVDLLFHFYCMSIDN